MARQFCFEINWPLGGSCLIRLPTWPSKEFNIILQYKCCISVGLKYFSKLEFWSVLPGFENEIAKVYIKSFSTNDEQNVKSHIFIKFLATQWGLSISRIYHANICLHDFKRKLCHIKSWKKKKQFRRNNWRCTKNANATGKKA